MSPSKSSARRSALALLAACLAVVGLAACGGGDDTTVADTTSTTTTSTEASSTDTGSTSATGNVDASQLRDAFNQQLLQVLTTTQNLTQAQAQCAIDELENTVSDEELQQAIEDAAQSGQPPQDLINEAFDAGAKCADQK
jgi:basic membrane lipoprotein Med (substrate-binding protein (PBP1-ABC) superfamily)